MAKFLYTNNAYSTLASGITDVATSLTVATGEGARFPSPGAGEQFALTLIDSSSNLEIVYCTSRSGDVLTISRGEEGTTNIPFNAGDSVELRITAAGLESAVIPGINSIADADAIWIDAGENISFGNAPNVGWAAGSHATQWEDGGSIMNQDGSAFSILGNAYLGGGWRRLRTGYGLRLDLNYQVGTLRLSTGASSGAADTDPSFSDAWTITSDKRMGLGTWTPDSGIKFHMYQSDSAACTLKFSNQTTGIGATNGAVFGIDSTENAEIWNYEATNLYLATNNTLRLTINSAGNHTIAAPDAGIALTVNGFANNFTSRITASSTSGQSFGLSVRGGTTAADYGIEINDQANTRNHFRVDGLGNNMLGVPSLATTATDGFPYIPTCSGTPTGTPTTKTGHTPIVYDTTNDKFYIYTGAAWAEVGGGGASEGGWTPQVTDASANTPTSYSTQEATYQKIGTRVICKGTLALSNLSPVSGNLRLTNLPFVPKTTGDFKAGGLMTFDGASMNHSAGDHVVGYVQVNTTYVTLKYFGTTVGSAFLTDTIFSSNGAIDFILIYDTDS
jgi:hypothetical protein